MQIYGREESSIIWEFCLSVLTEITIAAMLVKNETIIPIICIISDGEKV